MEAIRKESFTRSRLSIHFRLLGFLPLLFFIVQAIHYWRIGELGHILWMCNIGNLLLAIGLFLNHATLIRVAVLWTIPGLVVWFLYVVLAWGALLNRAANFNELEGVFSSTLAHLGGMVVGMLVLKKVRMESLAWLYAFGWYLVMQLLSRLVTSVDLNVNVAQKIPGGWEETFTVYWAFWLVLSALVAVILWLLGFLLNKLWASSP
jgi:hypothetical protein